MTISVNTLQEYMGADLNILITGPAGTGKTAMLQQAAKNLNLKMKYYNAASLDPFADLVGIPVPDLATKRVEYFRPRDVDEAEVIFMDEINRADSKTLNAIFELIQFRSINGEKLPKLKAVVAAMNPVSDEYDTDELDIALVDRFDIYLEAEAAVDYNYFKKKFGLSYARVGVEFFKDYQKAFQAPTRSNQNKLGYLSPRRLEKLMDVFQKFPREATVRAVLPSDVIVSTKDVAEKFNVALGNQKAPATATKAPTVRRKVAKTEADKVAKVLAMGAGDFRVKQHSQTINDAYKWAKTNAPTDAAKIRVAVAQAFRYGVGPNRMKANWGSIVSDFNDSEMKVMAGNWDPSKRSTFTREFGKRLPR